VTANHAQTAALPYKLRWYQYSLRTLMLAVLLASIGMSYVAVTIQRQRRQGAAAKAIERAGGHVESKPTWLGRLLRDDSLVVVNSVNLSQTHTTDAGLVNLRELRALRELWLGDTNVTDAGLLHFQGASQLKYLALGGTQVTDAGLSHLQGLHKLEVLFLHGTRVSDAGLVHLQGLSQLHNLSLSETAVTDAGLMQLRELRQLEWLDINGTKVTDPGVEKFHQALPNCTIIR
jgi:hypothetical protein